MAECSLVKVDEVQINCITLGKILDAFNGPLNEEQAWSLCHQSAKFLGQSWCEDGDKRRDFNLDGIDSVSMRKDGTVTIEEQEVAGDSTDEKLLRARERELVDALGRVIYQSLDYGFHAEEERELSHPLETLIDSMTISQETETDTDDKHSNDTLNSDEGIEDGNCSDEEEELRRRDNDGKITSFDQVLQACRQHIPDPAVAPNHYQAVCRALVNEVQELTTFLQRIASSKQTLRALASETSGEDKENGNIEDLQPREWARIWMMVLQELRHGVKLKKVTEAEEAKASIEYELTPYEILMDDIRSRRYQLNKIMVNGDIPPKVKREAHDIILDFIRSRPPLKPLIDRPDIEKDRLKKISHHERLLADIRSQPKLTPVSKRVLAKKPKLPKRRRRFGSGSRDSSSVSSDVDSEDLDSLENSPEVPKRKLKAEVILDWSDDDDMLETVTIPSTLPGQNDYSGDVFEPPSVQNNMYVYPERPKRPTTPPPKPKPTVMPKPPSKKLSAMHFPSIESDPGSPDIPSLPIGVSSIDYINATEEFLLGNEEKEEENEPLSPLNDKVSFLRDSPRRHSIGVCQSQRRSMMKHSKSSTPTRDYYRAPAHLSLTVDEVIHIRSVLIKAELENLRVNPKLYQAVAGEKVCFSCKNKFLIFKKKIRCKLCQRLVCSVCCKKMHLPRGHFLQIPVEALSPATPKRRRRKKRQSDYRGQKTAEKFKSISEPPTPSISPVRIPKFWRVENQSGDVDTKEEVCVMCKDFLLNALKSAQKTPTGTPTRTPTGTPTRSPNSSEHSTPTRKFSLGPAPNPPRLYQECSGVTEEFGNDTDTIEQTDGMAQEEAETKDKQEPVIPENMSTTDENTAGTPDRRLHTNEGALQSAAEESDSTPKGENGEHMRPWGLNNDDEELEELRSAAPDLRIPYVI